MDGIKSKITQSSFPTLFWRLIAAVTETVTITSLQLLQTAPHVLCLRSCAALHCHLLSIPSTVPSFNTVLRSSILSFPSPLNILTIHLTPPLSSWFNLPQTVWLITRLQPVQKHLTAPLLYTTQQMPVSRISIFPLFLFSTFPSLSYSITSKEFWWLIIPPSISPITCVLHFSVRCLSYLNLSYHSTQCQESHRSILHVMQYVYSKPIFCCCIYHSLTLCISHAFRWECGR